MPEYAKMRGAVRQLRYRRFCLLPGWGQEFDRQLSAWKDLKKKSATVPTPVEGKGIDCPGSLAISTEKNEIPEVSTTVQEEASQEGAIVSAPAADPTTTVQALDINPFSTSDDDSGAVAVLRDALSSDPQALPMIAQNESPRAYAVAYTVAQWEEEEGAKALADLDRFLFDKLLTFGISKAGKSNRVTAVLKTAESVLLQEHELNKAKGKGLF